MFVILNDEAINLDLIYRISIGHENDDCFLYFHGDPGYPSENCFKIETDGITEAYPIFELIVDAIARGDRILSINTKGYDVK